MDGACGDGTESYAYFTERVEQLCPCAQRLILDLGLECLCWVWERTGAGTNGECAKGLGKRAGVFDWKLTEKEMAELTDCHGWTLMTTLLCFRQLVVRVHTTYGT